MPRTRSNFSHTVRSSGKPVERRDTLVSLKEDPAIDNEQIVILTVRLLELGKELSQ